jgi:hypothetical protein
MPAIFVPPGLKAHQLSLSDAAATTRIRITIAAAVILPRAAKKCKKKSQLFYNSAVVQKICGPSTI